MRLACGLVASSAVFAIAVGAFGCSGGDDALFAGADDTDSGSVDSGSNSDSAAPDVLGDVAADQGQDSAAPDSSSADSASSDSGSPDVTSDSSLADTGVADSSVTDSAADVSKDVATDTSDASPACAPPSDPTKASLCLHLTPDTIKPVPSDPALDGKGVLLLQVFDTAHPDNGDAGKAAPIMEAVYPQQTSDAGVVQTIDISAIPTVHRFDGLPGTTVYVNALFLDDLSALKPGYEINYGTWIGGMNLGAGLTSNMPLDPVALKVGQATSTTIKLTALRRLKVTLHAQSGMPLAGNGQGPAKVVLLGSQQVQPGSMAMYGYAKTSCGNLNAAGGLVLEGFVYGTGPYYALGLLDDLGTDTGSNLPPGGIMDLDINGGKASLPNNSKVTYAADAYEVTKDLVLNLVIPSGGKTDTVSCNAGPDAGP